MLKADLRILQRMTKILGFDLHEYGSLLIASNVVLIDEVYVFLPILILRNHIAAFFNTGFNFCKDSVNLFPRVVLIVCGFKAASSNTLIHEIASFAKRYCIN